MSSDQQVAFDNWEEAAEELEKEELKQQESTPTQQQQSNQQQISDELKQQKKATKVVEDPREILRKKVASYQTMTFQQFESLSQEITENNKVAGKKVGNPVLKSDKDFNNYARILAKRFDSMIQNQDATIDDEKLSLFFEELTLYMYKNLEWKNLHEIQSKLRVIKKQRKTEEDKRRKQKEKQERLKKVQGEGSESKSISVTKQKQEDLFGGVSNINSKQEQDERKNKIITEEPKKQEKKEQEDDDDDFM